LYRIVILTDEDALHFSLEFLLDFRPRRVGSLPRCAFPADTVGRRGMVFALASPITIVRRGRGMICRDQGSGIRDQVSGNREQKDPRLRGAFSGAENWELGNPAFGDGWSWAAYEVEDRQ
jgi:hypothetical protein